MPSRERSKQDLRDKIKLEEVSKRDIRSIFARMGRDFRVRVAALGLPAQATTYEQEWKAVLQKHYQRVQNQFSGSVKSFMFRDSLLWKQEGEEVDQELLALALLEYRNQRSEEQAAIITQTSQENMEIAIVKAREMLIEQGEPTDNRTLAATAAVLLARVLGGRVDLIAMTETQNAAESAKMMEAQVSTGRVPAGTPRTLEQIVRPTQQVQEAEKEWDDIGDSVTRPTHREANGQRRPIDEPFQVGNSLLMFPGDTSLGAEIKETINCLHPSSIINFSSPKAFTRRFYDGEMISMHMSNGDTLTVTPNHPVLGRSGWVAANDIQHGDSLLCALNREGASFSGPNVDNAYSSVEEVFNSLDGDVLSVGSLGLGVNFHGEIPDHDVNVVWSNGKLVYGLKPHSSDPFSEFGLSSSEDLFRVIFYNRSLGEGFGGFFDSSSGFMSGHNEPHSFFMTSSRHALKHGFGSAPMLDAVNFEYSIDGASDATQLFGDRLYRHPAIEKSASVSRNKCISPNECIPRPSGMAEPDVFNYSVKASGCDTNLLLDDGVGDPVKVQFDSVVSVDRHKYSGYVYNLEDDKSYYICNSVVNHNCRCSALYFFGG